MPLASGDKLGPYEILSPIGVGGMGEVYKARDSRLERIVAIKVLPTATAASADARARLEREAKSISSLNHPNICTLHDVGRQGDIDYLVMEYLEGQTLADRLHKGPLPTSELFTVAHQIADALDRAHRQGLVHRDLKPGNIMLTRSGAKLLDFGLAKLTQDAVASNVLTQATRTTPLTGEGTLVGTMQYMSPEQLEGKEADARSDIFAFGAVLYEMATGKPAFEGSSQASLIVAIMKEEPKPMSAVQPLTPPVLDHVVRQCLAKEPDNRWQSAGDVNRALQWASQPGFVPGSVVPVPRRHRAWSAWAAWGVALLAMLLALVIILTRAEPARDVFRATVLPPEGNSFLFEGDYAGPPTLSPDGKWIAFVAVAPSGAKIWVRDPASLAARPLNGTEGASFPFWSPDSKSIAFFTETKVMRTDIATGQVFSVCSSPGRGRGGSWGQNDILVLSQSFQSELFQVSAAGGTPVPLTTKDTSLHSTHRWPAFLPDGVHFLYFAGNHYRSESGENGVWYASVDGTENRLLLPNLSDAAYADGHLLFVRDSVLFAQPFDLPTGRLQGEPRATKDRVQVDRTTWKANFSVSRQGLLAYQMAGGVRGAQMLLVDRTGNVLRTIGPQGNHYNLDLSSDGRQLVFNSQERPYGDLFHYDFQRNVRTRLTFDSQDKDTPILSPRGDRIAFSTLIGSANSATWEIRIMPVTGVGEVQFVVKDTIGGMWPMDWSPDGRALLCGIGNVNAYLATGLELVSVDRSGQRTLVVTGADGLASARISPDGRWLAYSAVVSGTAQVFVIPFRGRAETPVAGSAAGDYESTGRWQISTTGGDHPLWRGDSRELYYLRDDGTAMVVEVGASGDGFHVGHETELFRLALRNTAGCWDVSADGSRFAVNAMSGENLTPLILVHNWPAEIGL